MLPQLRGVPAALLAPVDAAGLAYFRIVFGAILVWQAWRFIDHFEAGLYFSGKHFYFRFWPFDFLRPWPEDGMTVHLIVMGVLAGLVALGVFYRVGAALLFLMFTYVFLMEEARYENHLYLVCLIAFLMVFLPAHRCLPWAPWLKPWRTL